ncbi:MAG: sulfotransferase family protein [Cyclobacteriaceae bacterium]|nr:sulfotransferase family protein [Cyclobacteriaceae bacterium]
MYRLRNMNFSGSEDIIDQSYKVFQQKGLMFIHIPKSAGVSVYGAIYNIDSLGHIPLFEYEKRFCLSGLYKFTFVRSPVQRLISAYNYLKLGGRQANIDLKYQKILKPCNSLNEFVDSWLAKEEIMKMEHFKSQSSYLKNSKGEIDMDFIGKYEKLEKDIARLVDLTGVDIKKIQLVNDTKYFDSDFDKSLISKIQEYYAEDYTNFNY